MSARELARALSEQNQALAARQSLTTAEVASLSPDGHYVNLSMGGSIVEGISPLNVTVAVGDAVLVGIVRGTSSSATYVVLGKIGAPSGGTFAVLWATVVSLPGPGGAIVSVPEGEVYGQVLNSYDPAPGDGVWVVRLDYSTYIVLGKIGAYAGGTGGGGSGAHVYIQSTEPTAAVTGDFWLKT